MVSFSKPILYVPLSKLSSATETVDLLVQHVFRLQGIPLDRPQFSSQVWKAFCQSLGTTASLTSSKHSQSNGQTERATQDPETALRCVISHHPASWSTFLPRIEYAQRSLGNTSTGMSPFILRDSNQHSSLTKRQRSLRHASRPTSDAVTGFGLQLHKIHLLASENLLIALRHPNISLAKRFGAHQKIYLWIPKNRHLKFIGP